MTHNSDKLQKKIHSELEMQHGKQDVTMGVDTAKKFGLFIQASMNNLGQSVHDLGHALKIEHDLAKAILDGMLPVDEFDDILLNDIAVFLQHEPNTLRLLLGREIRATRDNQDVFKQG
jgi:hypothetical protein